jgi:hypothetical protein
MKGMQRILAIVTFLIPISTLMLIGCREKPLLQDVSVSPDTITPNADGQTDLAKITFLLNRSANVSISLHDESGETYTFRAPTPLGLNKTPYEVFFGGVVEGFKKPGETWLDYTVTKRMLPDGHYTWQIKAEPIISTEETERTTSENERVEVTGTITLQDADTTLPAIRGFSVYPKEFSPNQDGIADRVTLNLDLKKDVEELNVYLLSPDGTRHHIPEDEGQTPLNEAGWHTFDYDGGIDLGVDPPPDGVYTVSAESRDRMGQRVIATDTVTIINAGLPAAYILNGEVNFDPTTLVLSDTLCFTLTVENDSNTYIRTTGPWPGTMYRSDQNFNTLGWSEESGAFRVGINYDTSLRDYPFRWGIGTPEHNLVQIDEYWYLPPFSRANVTGCIQIIDIPPRNPLYYWGGLIHEDVEIADVNNRVDPHFIRIWEP